MPRHVWLDANRPDWARLVLDDTAGPLRADVTYALSNPSITATVGVVIAPCVAELAQLASLVLGVLHDGDRSSISGRQRATGSIHTADGEVSLHPRTIRSGGARRWVAEVFVHNNRCGNYSVRFYAETWTHVVDALSAAAEHPAARLR